MLKKHQIKSDKVQEGRVIDLDNPPETMHAMFVVVENDKGIGYSAQCGGMLCSQPVVVGNLIVLMVDIDHWQGFLDHTCNIGCQHNLVGIDMDLPLNDLYGYDICIDKERLEMGTESFIPVIFDGKKAWLFTMANCD